MATAPEHRQVAVNPSEDGLAGGLGDIVVSPEGAWVKFGDGATDWQAFPGEGGGGSGTVESIVAGDGIAVDDSDPANPVVSAAGAMDLKAAILAFAQSQYPTINRVMETEVRATTIDYTFQTISPNAATNNQTQAVKGGVTQLATSAAGAGGGLITRIGQATAPIAANGKTDVPWLVACVMTLPATVDANTQAAVVMETITFSAAVVAGVIGGGSTTKYSLAIGVTPPVASAVDVNLSGAYVLFLLGFDGTTVRAWVSSPHPTTGIFAVAPTPIGVQTDITNVPTAACSGMVLLHQNSAVASKAVRVDALYEAWSGAVA